jgi:hypothetical protein
MMEGSQGPVERSRLTRNLHACREKARHTVSLVTYRAMRSEFCGNWEQNVRGTNDRSSDEGKAVTGRWQIQYIARQKISARDFHKGTNLGIMIKNGGFVRIYHYAEQKFMRSIKQILNGTSKSHNVTCSALITSPKCLFAPFLHLHSCATAAPQRPMLPRELLPLPRHDPPQVSPSINSRMWMLAAGFRMGIQVGRGGVVIVIAGERAWR